MVMTCYYTHTHTHISFINSNKPIFDLIQKDSIRHAASLSDMSVAAFLPTFCTEVNTFCTEVNKKYYILFTQLPEWATKLLVPTSQGHSPPSN